MRKTIVIIFHSGRKKRRTSHFGVGVVLLISGVSRINRTKKNFRLKLINPDNHNL